MCASPLKSIGTTAPAPEPQKKIKLSHKQMERESDKKQRDWMTEHEPFSNVCLRSPNHGNHQTTPEKKTVRIKANGGDSKQQH
jgi:hypothetical protein